MLKPTVLNILFFWLVKYIVFYVFMSFKNNVLVSIDDIRRGEDLLYYLWIFSFLPITAILILSAPMYYVFRFQTALSSLLILTITLIAEYLLYTWLASQADLMNGVYNAIISLLVFTLFFFKKLKNIFNQHK